MESGRTHKIVWETSSSGIHGAGHTSMAADTSNKAAQDEEGQAHPT